MPTCGDKVIHKTYGRAQRALNAMKDKGRDRLQIYTCKHCGYFHLGHSKYTKFIVRSEGKARHFDSLKSMWKWADKMRLEKEATTAEPSLYDKLDFDLADVDWLEEDEQFRY